MDIRDFEGITGFKVILPALYVINWIAMFMGPSLFPVIYQQITIFAFIYILFKILYVLLAMIYITVRGYSQVSRAKPDYQPD